MTSEIWYKSYQSKVDTIILVFSTTRHYVLVLSTGSEAYGMYLPLYISSTKIAQDLVFSTNNTRLDRFVWKNQQYMYLLLYYISSARIARDL